MEDAASDTLEKALALAMAGYHHITGASVQDSVELAEGIMAKLCNKYTETGIMALVQTKAQPVQTAIPVARGVGRDTGDDSMASEITDTNDLEAGGTNPASAARLHVANGTPLLIPISPHPP